MRLDLILAVNSGSVLKMLHPTLSSRLSTLAWFAKLIIKMNMLQTDCSFQSSHSLTLDGTRNNVWFNFSIIILCVKRSLLYFLSLFLLMLQFCIFYVRSVPIGTLFYRGLKKLKNRWRYHTLNKSFLTLANENNFLSKLP